MLDANGVLNPGLMPQTVEDLRKIAPPRDEVDDQLVARWNRVTDVWREDGDFRLAVLKYATSRAFRDPSSTAIWPEVVYPLIELTAGNVSSGPATKRSSTISPANCCVPVRGVRLDRTMARSMPQQVAEQLDEDLSAFVDDPHSTTTPRPPATIRPAARTTGWPPRGRESAVW